MNALVLPVNVVEPQAAHLAGTEPVDRQQQQHREIAYLRGSVATIRVQELLDLGPARTLRQPLMRV